MLKDGVFYPGFEISELEKNLFDEFESMLKIHGFKYLSVPSLVEKTTYERQGVVPWESVFKIDVSKALAGSAEQGILEMFQDSFVEPCMIYAKNQCFRAEENYEGLKKLKEFIKLEQFVFCDAHTWRGKFDLVLSMAIRFLEKNMMEYRVVNVTETDKGYHLLKFDIEVYTESYGWMETHSCSYFGTEQTKRFGITGATHTISNTGIASPRILIPFLERIKKNK